MPIGITTDVLATLFGAILGLFIGKRLPESMKHTLNTILGLSAITMGLVLIQRQNALSAVVLAVILGGVVGEVMGLDGHIRRGVTALLRRVMGGEGVDDAFLTQVSAVVVLLCCGGTGWYGALNEGFTGDGSILITKSILDLVTAMIFAAQLGKIVPILCIPQALVYAALYLASGAIQPLISPEMLGDFSAVGGLMTFCAGLSLTGMKKDLKLLNLLPGLIFVFFVSAGWMALMG